MQLKLSLIFRLKIRIHLKNNTSKGNIGNTIVDFLVNGNFSGKNLNLNCKNIRVNGFCDIDGLEAKDVLIKGRFSGKNIQISGMAKFKGKLNTEDGQS